MSALSLGYLSLELQAEETLLEIPRDQGQIRARFAPLLHSGFQGKEGDRAQRHTVSTPFNTVPLGNGVYYLLSYVIITHLPLEYPIIPIDDGRVVKSSHKDTDLKGSKFTQPH